MQRLHRRVWVMLWNYAAQGYLLTLGMVKVALLARILGVREYGLLAQFLAMQGLVSMALALNLGHGFLRFASATAPEERAAYGWTTIALQSGLHVVVLLGALTLRLAKWPDSAVLQEGRLIWILLGCSATTLIQSQLLNQLIADRRGTLFAHSKMIANTIILIGAVAGGLWGGDALTAATGMLGGIVLGSIVVGILLGPYFWRPILRPSLIRPLLAFCLPLLPASMAYWGITSGNRLLISYFLGPESLGRFAVVGALPAMIMYSYTVLASILFASLSRLYDRQSYREVETWLETAYRLYAVVGVAMACAGFVCADTVIAWVAQEEYLFEGMPWVFLITGLGIVGFGLLQIASRGFALECRPWYASGIWVTVAVLSMGANVLAIPRYGLIGCAVVNLVALIVGQLLVRGFAVQRLSPAFPYGIVVKHALLSVGVAAVVRHVAAISVGVFQVMLGVIVFFLVLAFAWMIGAIDSCVVQKVLR